MYAIALVTKNRFKVVKILGTMLTFQTTAEKGLSEQPSAIAVGLVVHYLVGIGFACVYSWLWRENIVQANFINTTLMGIVNGLIAAVGWSIFIAIHPNPPRLPLKSYLIAIAAGHIFFAYGIWMTYAILGNSE